MKTIIVLFFSVCLSPFFGYTMEGGHQRKIKHKKSLSYIVLKHNFIKKYISLNSWTCDDVADFFINFGLKDQAQIVKKENIDGNDLITLLSNNTKESKYILKNHLNLDSASISNLFDIYWCIFKIRKKHAQNFDEEEEAPNYKR
jgi:hypothetical protein